MKILFYNVAHCRGMNGKIRNYLSIPLRYLLGVRKLYKERIRNFVNDTNADIICLAEIDSEHIHAFEQNGYKIILKGNRYGEKSILNYLPFFKNHYFAILSKKGVASGKIHYLKNGIKKAVAISKIGDSLTVLMVHLAVFTALVRKKQLKELAELIVNIPNDVILCGDFNIYKGTKELSELLEVTGMSCIDPQPTCPSCNPKYMLDLFMASKDVEVSKKSIFNADYSDHLPVMLEVSAR